MLPETAIRVTEHDIAAALRVAMSDGTGRVDEAGGASLEVWTVVHDNSLHQLLAFWTLDLLFVQQCLLQLFGAFGAVTQVLSDRRTSFSL